MNSRELHLRRFAHWQCLKAYDGDRLPYLLICAVAIPREIFLRIVLVIKGFGEADLGRLRIA
jgi:hypothetical protein